MAGARWDAFARSEQHSPAERACGRSAHHAPGDSVKPDHATAPSVIVGVGLCHCGGKPMESWPEMI